MNLSFFKMIKNEILVKIIRRNKIIIRKFWENIFILYGYNLSYINIKDFKDNGP